MLTESPHQVDFGMGHTTDLSAQCRRRHGWTNSKKGINIDELF